MKVTTAKVGACLAVALASNAAPVMACDDHIGECEIEDWLAKELGGTMLLEGVATCDTGRVTLRLYDNDTFVAMERAYIEGHAFRTLVHDVETKTTYELKYSIDTSY